MSDRAAVCAVVVAYHPESELLAHVIALRPQVDELLLIDNGSGPTCAPLLQHCAAAGATLLALPDNIGIAAALNLGLRHARQRGFAWLATFDQDSHAPAELISSLLAASRQHPAPARIASLSPQFRNRTTGEIIRKVPLHPALPSQTWIEVGEVITSGSLLQMDAVADVGEFDEELFIDGVDTDFCLRCRAAGYQILEVQTITLEHQLGASRSIQILGRRKTITCHSPLRRYYIARNLLHLCKKWLPHQPAWALSYSSKLLRTSLMVLFEPERGAKLRALRLGLLDGWLGHMGRCQRSI